MNNDQLRIDLADLADEVTPVDLRDRVLRTSRKIGVRRAAASSLLAVAVVAAIAAGAFAALPWHGTSTHVPAGTVSPAPAASTTPTPTPSTSTAPSPKTSGSVRPAHPAPSLSTGPLSSQIAGTTFYVDLVDGASAQTTILHSVIGGVDHTIVTLPVSGGQTPYYTVSVSPTGTRIAWITDAGGLYVANIDGSQQRIVTSSWGDIGGTVIQWWSDSYFTAAGNHTIGVDAVTATITNHNVPMSQQGPVSPNGKYVAARTQGGQRYVATVNGAGRQNFSYAMPAGGASTSDGWSVHSVSNSGRYIAIGGNPTDASRNTGSAVVVDVKTSKVVRLPDSGKIGYIEFLADGTVLVGTDSQYVLLDSSFHKIATETTDLSSVIDGCLDNGCQPSYQGTWLTYIP